MSRSLASRASNASSRMLEDLANRSQTKYISLNSEYADFKDPSMTKKWESSGMPLDYTSAATLEWEEVSTSPN